MACSAWALRHNWCCTQETEESNSFRPKPKNNRFILEKDLLPRSMDVDFCPCSSHDSQIPEANQYNNKLEDWGLKQNARDTGIKRKDHCVSLLRRLSSFCFLPLTTLYFLFLFSFLCGKPHYASCTISTLVTLFLDFFLCHQTSQPSQRHLASLVDLDYFRMMQMSWGGGKSTLGRVSLWKAFSLKSTCSNLASKKQKIRQSWI